MVNGLGQQNSNLSYSGVKEYIPEDARQGIQNVATGAKETVTKAAGDVASFNEGNNPILGSVQGTKDDKLKSGMYTAGTAVGFTALNIWLNKINGPLSRPWNESLYGTLQKFGDKIGKPVDSFLDSIKPVTSKVGQAKNAALEALPFLKTPTKNVNSMAKSQLAGFLSRSTNDYGSMIRGFIEQDAIKTGEFGNLFGETAKNFTKKEGLEHLKKLIEEPKKYQDGWVKIAKFLENRNDLVRTSPGFKVGIPIIGNLLGIKPITVNLPKPLEFLKRKTSGIQISNKLKSSFKLDKEGIKTLYGENSTRLGRALPKAFSGVLESVTSGHAGWLLTFVMAAQFFSTTIKDTVEAPWGEKFKTFMDGLVKNIVPVGAAFLYAMPQNTVGGMKYIGMGGAKGTEAHIKAVTKYTDAFKSLNARVDAGTISAAEHALKSKELKTMLKGNSKWYQQPFKWLGNLMSMGQETIKPVELAKQTGKMGHKVTDLFSKLSFQVKSKGGGALRFALGMFVISSLISKMFGGITHTIFGKPKKIKEEEDKAKAEKEAAKKAKADAKAAPQINGEELGKRLMKYPELVAQLEANPQMMQQIAQNPQLLVQILDKLDAENINTPASGAAISPALQERLQSRPAPAQQPQQQAAPAPVINNTVQTNTMPMQQNAFDVNAKQPQPSVVNTSQTNAQEPADSYSYIPSSDAAVIAQKMASFDAKIDAAIAKADRAEASARKYL